MLFNAINTIVTCSKASCTRTEIHVIVHNYVKNQAKRNAKINRIPVLPVEGHKSSTMHVIHNPYHSTHVFQDLEQNEAVCGMYSCHLFPFLSTHRSTITCNECPQVGVNNVNQE